LVHVKLGINCLNWELIDCFVSQFPDIAAWSDNSAPILGASRRVVLQDSETPPTRCTRKTQTVSTVGLWKNAIIAALIILISYQQKVHQRI
jgi:hypothetical protein